MRDRTPAAGPGAVRRFAGGVEVYDAVLTGHQNVDDVRTGRGPRPQVQPVVLGGYPSALEALASEQCAGLLHISPVLVNAAGETLTPAARQRIASAFGCRVGNYYGTSEAVGLTFECPSQRLHVNSDWYIVEPVDEYDRLPVRISRLLEIDHVAGMPVAGRLGNAKSAGAVRGNFRVVGHGEPS